MKKRRKNMFTNARRRNSAQLMEACKKLDKKIICQIKTLNRQVIKNKILQGVAKVLWEGYRIATDCHSEHIPPYQLAQHKIKPTCLHKSSKQKFMTSLKTPHWIQTSGTARNTQTAKTKTSSHTKQF